MDELNFSHFEIERSTDGANFNKVSRIEAKKGDSINEYEMKDRDVRKGQTYYYRLKLMDIDNRYEYSQIRTALIDENLDFSIYPNPTNGVLSLSFEENVAVEVIIHNAAGHEMLRVKVDNEIYHFDTSSFPAGMYLCSIATKEGTTKSTKRFVKVK